LKLNTYRRVCSTIKGKLYRKAGTLIKFYEVGCTHTVIRIRMLDSS